MPAQHAAARGVVCAAIRAAAGSCGGIRIDAVLIEVQVQRIALCQIRQVMVDEVECLDAELQRLLRTAIDPEIEALLSS